MIYHIKDGRFVPACDGEEGRAAGPEVGLFPLAQAQQVFDRLAIDARFLPELLSGRAAKFESHDGFDLIRLSVLNGKKIALSGHPVVLYLSQGRLLAFSDSERMLRELASYAEKAEEVAFDRVLYFLFKRLTEEDSGRLDGIEAEILQLEDRLLEGEHAPECARQIAALRRKLFTLKSYYEQFYNILDGIMENENGLFGREALRYFKIFSGKLDRLGRQTGNLRDYITQVRESYQAQVDIELNKIMKLFTVITAVISPLTLIAGWYGMNFSMPEYHWALGYPAVILLSAAVVGLCVYYFKRHRWF